MVENLPKCNRLTPLYFHHKNKYGAKYYVFRCDCGNEKVIRLSSVLSGQIKSCGCLIREITSKRMYEPAKGKDSISLLY